MTYCDAPNRSPGTYEDFIADKYLRKTRPNLIHFELTHRCNLRCIHCLFLKDAREELSTGEVFNVLLQLQEMGVFYLSLSGGEIFVRQDIDEILDFLLEHRFLLTIYTNGTLLNQARVEKLAALNPQSVEISVYGADEGVHDAITGMAGSFRKTTANIKALHAAGVSTLFKGFLLKDNFRQRREMIDLADELGVNHSFDFNLIPRENGDVSNLATGLTLDQLQTVYHEVANEGLILRDHVKIIDRNSQLPKGGSVICNAGIISGAIRPDGEVLPCPILRLPMGNIRARKFLEIWGTDAIDPLRHMKIEDLKECADCSVVKYCNRCPGVAYLETGDYLGPAPNAVCSKYKGLAETATKRRN